MMTKTDRELSAILAQLILRRMHGYLYLMRQHLYNPGVECFFMLDYIMCLPRHKAGTVTFGGN